MEQTYNETLEYVIRLTPHIEKGDVPSAILMLLIDLGFHTSSDGFGYLRKAILLRCNDPDMQANVIYQEIAYMPRYKVSRKQVDQAIRNAIEAAWEDRNRSKWDYFFPESELGEDTKPTNKDFIAEIACVMELWRKCRREVVRYGNK